MRHTYGWIADANPDKDDSEPEVVNERTVSQGETINHFPYDGIRTSYGVATFNSCPWVMVVGGYFQHYNFHTLNDIPNQFLFPWKHKTPLLVSFEVMEDILKESVWIAEIHLGFTSYLMDFINRKKGFKLSVWMILFLILPPDMTLWNYGMSRLIVAVPLLDQGLHL
jgi:hypothetical protein